MLKTRFDFDIKLDDIVRQLFFYNQFSFKVPHVMSILIFKRT
ncbi:MAG: hypothetical protein ACD_65C00221G0001 [uncultured bacterium]|nr:MAG: hypothetical protein ACD_65C00221G0001 [uncultured bacterium]